MHLSAAKGHIKLHTGVVIRNRISLPFCEQCFDLIPRHKFPRHAGCAGKLLANWDGSRDIHALGVVVKQKRAGLFSDCAVRDDGEAVGIRLVLLKFFCCFHRHALEISGGLIIKISEFAQAELNAHHHFPR